MKNWFFYLTDLFSHLNPKFEDLNCDTLNISINKLLHKRTYEKVREEYLVTGF